jgi:flagellar hook-associated protein 1 FlgK
MSLGQALSASTAGLRTAQTGLALIASNIANAETPGYVRKTLLQQTSSAGGNGVSVRIGAVNRELDIYLQRQMRVETSGGAYADLRARYYERLQQVYGQPGSEAALETVFNKFTTALQALSTNPDSTSARSAALSAAQVLTQQLNSMTTDVQGLRGDAELALADAVTRANNAMAQIAAINRQLATTTTADATAASLYDQRDAAIDTLSELIDIRVVGTDHNQVNVFTNSGIQLVSTQASQFSFDATGTMTAQVQWSADPAKRTAGTLTLLAPTGSAYDLLANNAIRSGQIAALVEMRDHVLVEAQHQLDAVAAALAQALSDVTATGSAVTVGPQAGFDIDTAGLLAGNVIHLTYTDGAGEHRISIVRVDDPSALPLSGDATAAAGDEVIGLDFSGGLAAIVNALNGRFNGALQFSNPAGTTLRILDDGAANTTSIGQVSSTRTVTSLTGGSTALPFFTDAAAAYSGAITSSGSQSVGFAGRITVNAALLADPTRLVVYQAGIFTGDPARPTFIYDQLMSAGLTFSPQTGIGTGDTPFIGTLPSFMRQVVSLQGEAADNAANLASGQAVVVNSLRARVAEGSAVDIDQEMANLLALQTAYGANARVMAAVKDMLEILMDM